MKSLLVTDCLLRKLFAPSGDPVDPLFFSGFSVSIGQEIRHGCQFLHSIFRALGHLPGGLARFLPCQPGAHFARLSLLGWGRYGHGLSSRPRESCGHRILAPLSDFFGYPDGAATELFNGTLTLRYSSTPFSKKLPSWLVSHLSCCMPVVAPGPGTSVHFPDHDPVLERPAKRLRITGKSSALRREPFSGDGLPTPKRWKRSVPQSTGSMRIEDGVPPFLPPRTEGWLTSMSDTKDLSLQVRSLTLSALQQLLLPFN